MPPRPLLLFAPGAGAPASSAWMEAWCVRLSALGTVVPFDYRYRREGRRSPDRLPVLIEAHREALAEARARHRGATVLIGKSMGGRIGCHLSLEVPVEALVCLGYPLKGQRGQLRDEVLLSLKAPILFVQGTRDPLCPLPLLEGVRSRMAAPSALHVVEGGDHSLKVAASTLKALGQTQDGSDLRVVEAIRQFLDARLGPPAP